MSRYSPQLKSIEGSALLALLFFLFGFSLSGQLLLKKTLLYWEEGKQRKQTWLCLKNSFDLFERHIQFIKKSNAAIKVLNGVLIVKPTPETFQMKKAVQKIQEVKDKYAFGSFLLNAGCVGLQKVALGKLFPTQRNGLVLKRNSLGLALLQEGRKNFLLPSRGNPPLIFILRGKVQYQPRLVVSHLKETLLLRSENE